MKKNQILAFLNIFFLLIMIFITDGLGLYESSLTNLGRVYLLKASYVCNLLKETCLPPQNLYPFSPVRPFPPLSTAENSGFLLEANNLFNQVELSQYKPSRFYEHYAGIAFGLGDRFRAINYLNQENGSIIWASGIPEKHLLDAYEAISKKNWGQAIIGFQKSQLAGREKWIKDDYLKFDLAIYHYFTQKAEFSRENIDKFYAGKYAFRAGNYEIAEKYILASISGELNDTEKADAYRMLGSIYLENNKKASLSALLKAYRLNPFDLRIYYFLQENYESVYDYGIDIDQLSEKLPNKPSYHINESYKSGLLGTNQENKPYKINDWELVGFDILDIQALELGTTFPIAIWWRFLGEPKKIHEFKCLIVNDYCIQIFNEINLVPNAGFEWTYTDFESTSISGYPIGWYEYNNEKVFASEDTFALQTYDNKNLSLNLTPLDDTENLQIRSYALPITSSSMYLFSLTLNSSEGGNPAVGCVWLGNPSIFGSNKELGFVTSAALDVEWKTYSVVLVPPEESTACQIMLRNYQEGRSVQFDNLILIPITAPSSVDKKINNFD